MPGAIPHQRLASQRLADAGLAGVTDAVRWLGAVQAQIYPAARWSIGQRAGGVSAVEVDASLARGELIRTHVLRDTWHLVSAQDVHWLLDLTGPRVQQRNATMYRKLGLDAALLARTDGLLVDALAGGRHLTRTEIAAALAQRGIHAAGVTLAYVLMHAELSGRVGSGARRGHQHTYALLEERAPRGAGCSRDEALAELVRRYFVSHGPATVKDFAAWSSLTIADAKRGLEIVGGALEETVVGERRYWSAPDAGPPARGPRAHLLQAYDEYTVAYRDSRDIVDPDGLAAVIPGRTARFTHNIVLDGRIAGHWRHPDGAPDRIEVQLARPLDATQRGAVDEAIGRYGRFLGEDFSPSSAPRTSSSAAAGRPG